MTPSGRERRLNLIGVTSVRFAGATSMAAGIAGRLSPDGRTLLVDLNPDLPEQATLLDVDGRVNVYHLAHRAQLAAVSAAELEDHVRWHEGLAVLPGIADPSQATLLRDHFLAGLLAAAADTFEWVVIDLGRARLDLSAAATSGLVLWVLTPSPLGLAAFDRRFGQMRTAGVSWLENLRMVINQMADDSLAGVADFLTAEHGVTVAGTVPYEPALWRGIELSHSLQAFSVEIREEARYVSWFGKEALRTRSAIEQIVERLKADMERRSRVGVEA